MVSKTLNAETFRAARERLGMTQTQLAERMGVAKNTIYRKERTDGKGMPITVSDELVLAGLLAEMNIKPPRPRKAKA